MQDVRLRDGTVRGFVKRVLNAIRRLAAAAWGRNAPLRLRLVLLVGFAMLPPGILAFWQAGYSYSTALTALEGSLEQSAQLASSEQDRLIRTSRDVLTSLSAQPPIRAGRGESCRRALQRAIADLKQYEAAGVVDANGVVTCSTTDEANVNVGDRAWFQDLQKGREFVVSDPLVGRLAGKKGIVVAIRLNDAEGKMSGALSTMIGIDQFTQSYRTKPLQREAVLVVLNRDGGILSGNEQSAAVEKILPARSVRDGWLRSSSKTFNDKGADGVKRVYAVSPILDSKVFVVLGVPSSTVLNPLALQFAWGIFTPLLMWALAVVVVSFGIERLVVRWITYLERVTSAYAAGERNARPTRAADAAAEIRSLGQTFSRMADTISSHEAELRESLAQKDVLVREIHHRVKNNLQIVISLLNLHARRISNPQAEGAFSDVRGRINALATLHRRLYESEHLQQVDLKWFIEDICHEMRRSGLARGRNITLTTALPNEKIGPDVAVPLGLLVTEAVTNAYKHAFTGRPSGRVEINAVREDENYLSVSINDDGVGLSAADPSSSSTGLGQSLIDAFVRQLSGELSTESNGGTSLRVRFRCPIVT